MTSNNNNGTVDKEGFYKILGVDKNASQKEIENAYKKQRKILHPDKHIDESEKYNELFQELQIAYATLKDPQKRSLYDKYGPEYAERGRMPDIGSFDLFDLLINGHRHQRQRRPRGPSKSPVIETEVAVTLEELFSGSLKSVRITRRTGHKKKSASTCVECRGQGFIVVIQRLGSMIMQSKEPCDRCNGIGYALREVSAQIEFHIPVGARNGETVVIAGEGHEYPGHTKGDVVVRLRMERHPVFTRRGADLIMTHELNLIEALCGYRIELKSVCGKTLVVTGKEGEVVQAGDIKCVYGQGMPIRHDTQNRGNLLIKMKVTLPSLSEQERIQLKSIFEDNNTDKDTEEKESNNNTLPTTTKKKKQKVIEVEADPVQGTPRWTPDNNNNDDDDRAPECHQM